MANYEGYARSNYFKVRDVEAFEDFCDRWQLEVIDNEKQGDEKLYGFLEDSGGGFASYVYDEETGDTEDADMWAELSVLLEPGWVAVTMEVGHEKLCYVSAHFHAVDSTGKEVYSNPTWEFHDTLEKEYAGQTITEAQY